MAVKFGVLVPQGWHLDLQDIPDPEEKYEHMTRFAQEAERIGVDSVWVPEYWAYDAFTPLAAIAAVTDRLRLATGIAQLGARTPAMLAMTALGVQAISGGRLILGIGVSGPQVMEGWHGVAFDRPVQRTRETIEIVRRVDDHLHARGAIERIAQSAFAPEFEGPLAFLARGVVSTSGRGSWDPTLPWLSTVCWPALAAWKLNLGNSGSELQYTFAAEDERTGIPALLLQSATNALNLARKATPQGLRRAPEA